MEHSMSIFLLKYFCAAAWRLARRLLHEGWHATCYPPPPPPPPPGGGRGGDPIVGQVFFIVKRKNRVVFNEGNKT
jgi:hypothetical protein